jgi:intein/homing endonuclease
VLFRSNKSRVVNRYHKKTSKLVYTIETISGREIIATHDHKFMTYSDGWVEVYKLNNSLKLGINLMPNYISSTNKEIITIINNNTSINNNLLSILNLTSSPFTPLTNVYYYMSIMRRLAGFYLRN